jgi:hypothetical protein
MPHGRVAAVGLLEFKTCPRYLKDEPARSLYGAAADLRLRANVCPPVR